MADGRPGRRIAVIGAGWAGLAAAVRATGAGHAVTLWELAPMPGGRARSDDAAPDALDNGQHVLLGGYDRTVALMREVGVDVEQALERHPLALRHADGSGLALSGRGPRVLDLLRALVTARGLAPADRIALVRTGAAWRARAFACSPTLTVARLLAATATERLRRLVFDPLCVAALNTAPAEASAAVFLAVMRDSLFGPRASSDLLLPRVSLAHLLPLPALDWLARRGATVNLRSRVVRLARAPGGWQVETAAGPAGRPFEAIVLATPALEAARLAAPVAAGWARTAAALEHAPIATLRWRVPARPRPALPLQALASDDRSRPAQFAFWHGPDEVSLVVSAAQAWVVRGTEALTRAAEAQLREALGLRAGDRLACRDVRIDRRATFCCTAGLVRPCAAIAPGLVAAGDYVESPYPATLEAAVRAGEAAAAAAALDAGCADG